MKERPFDNFRVTITDPSYFFGRDKFLREVCESPFQVRILLGGRRIGKTSALRAIEWNLLDPYSKHRAFPVFVSLQVEQPKDLDNLRYILIARLREAIERWRKVPGAGIRDMYRQFLRQVADGEVAVSFLQQLNVKVKITNPDHERKLIHDDFRLALLKSIEEIRKLDFEGICFLFDEAEFIVRKGWANDAWSYFRGLKDTDTALKTFLGLLLSGYRDLKNYQQKIGSPLYNIADIDWLHSLADLEIRDLITYRCQEEQLPLGEKAYGTIIAWTGGHPYLTQQMLNGIFDSYKENRQLSLESLIRNLLRQHDHDFSAWWNEDEQADGFGDTERTVYKIVIQQQRETIENLAKIACISYGEAENILDVLSGTGVVQRLDEESYQISSKLFEKWVKQQVKT